MGCNCGGSTRAQQQTGTRRAVAQGSMTPQVPVQQGWYWTGPKRAQPTTPQPTPSA